MRRLTLLKPLRESRAVPLLTPAAVARNNKRDWRTSIAVDLNVLFRVDDVDRGALTLPESGLQPLLDIVNRTPVELIAGFGLREAPADRIVALRDSWDRFTRERLGLIDTPDGTRGAIAANPRNFEKLDEIYRQMMSPFYGAMLVLAFVSKSSKKPYGFDLFRTYIDECATRLDMVSMFPAKIAQCCFADPSHIKSDAVGDICKRIRKNFIKGGSSVAKVAENALNAAWDLTNFYSPIIVPPAQSGEDIWIATMDEGLAALDSLAYFVMTEDGNFEGHVDLNFGAGDAGLGQYWQESENYLVTLLSSRGGAARVRKSSEDEARHLIAACERLIVDLQATTI